jgi:hypothetical protein
MELKTENIKQKMKKNRKGEKTLPGPYQWTQPNSSLANKPSNAAQQQPGPAQHIPSPKISQGGGRPHPLRAHGGQHDGVLLFSSSLAASPRSKS